MTDAAFGATKMLFMRIAWMTRYQGIASDDAPVGGGSYVSDRGYGHEIFNFQPVDGMVYGYGQPGGAKWSEAKVNLSRLGASSSNDSIEDVLVLWCATDPKGGLYVVGWYRNATVFRGWQQAPIGSNRRYADEDCGYFVRARAEDAVLLSRDERVFPVPYQKPGMFGQSNIWYADDPAVHGEFRDKVLAYVRTRIPPRDSTDGRGLDQPNPQLRVQVEKAAVDRVAQHYSNLGYAVRSVEKDNVGWDLEATLDNRLLRVEVKGLSGSVMTVDLTPNEYEGMKSHQASYRLCIVTDALKDPQLAIFSHNSETSRWETPEGRVLTLREVISVRCSCEA